MLGDQGKWWTTTESDSAFASGRGLKSDYNNVTINLGLKGIGYSVRCLSDNIINIKDVNYQERINIYPNPATDKVYIDCAERQNYKMQVYNIIGECVFESELTNGTNTIDISFLTTGIYMIRLTGEDGTYHQKLIKN